MNLGPSPWLSSLIWALGRLRQEDYPEFEASLTYTARTYLNKQNTNKYTQAHFSPTKEEKKEFYLKV